MQCTERYSYYIIIICKDQHGILQLFVYWQMSLSTHNFITSHNMSYAKIILCVILQESSVIQVHVTGAFMAFVLGVVYCFVQTGITKRMYPMYNGFSIWVWRLGISLLGMFALVLSKPIHSVIIYCQTLYDLQKTSLWCYCYMSWRYMSQRYILFQASSTRNYRLQSLVLPYFNLRKNIDRFD